MFTGIIEEIGTIESLKNASQGAVITVACENILDDLKIGDSVAIDGACQTVTKLFNNRFEVEASQETLNLTIFKNYKSGTKVNLERAMTPKSRFGGHIVTGHIDGTGEFIKRVNQGIADLFYFKASECVAKYLIYKGSVSVNGISLTVASLEDDMFSISVISHTEKSTNLKYLSSGNNVNLESDIFAKYIEKFVSKTDNTTGNITVNYLEQHGFME